jgi:hypothetical protein
MFKYHKLYKANYLCMYTSMGNTPAKPSYNLNTLTEKWDKEHKRMKYEDKNAVYVFNFYGEYTREEFLKSGVDDPEIEQWVKNLIDEYNSNDVYRKCRGIAAPAIYKGRQYGIAWFNRLYIDPMSTITLSSKTTQKLKVCRFFDTAKLVVITCLDTNRTIQWNPTNADVTARYICNLAEADDVSVVENDFGILETKKVVRNKDELKSTLKELIEYMTAIQDKKCT